MSVFDNYFKGLEEALNYGYYIKAIKTEKEVFTTIEKYDKATHESEIISFGEEKTLLHSLIEASLKIDGKEYDSYKENLADANSSLFKRLTTEEAMDYVIEDVSNVCFYKTKDGRVISSIESLNNGIIKSFISDDIQTCLGNMNIYFRKNDIKNIDDYSNHKERINELRIILAELIKMNKLTIDAVNSYYEEVSQPYGLNNDNGLSFAEASRLSAEIVKNLPEIDISGMEIKN